MCLQQAANEDVCYVHLLDNCIVVLNAIAVHDW